MIEGRDAIGRGETVEVGGLDARDVEFVRTLEANGLDLLAAAVRRQIVRDHALSRRLLLRPGASAPAGPRAGRERSLSPAPPAGTSASPSGGPRLPTQAVWCEGSS